MSNKVYEILVVMLFFSIIVVSIQGVRCTPELPPPPSDYIDEVDVSNFTQKLWTIAVSRDMLDIFERITKRITGDRRFTLDRRERIITKYLKPERRSNQRRKSTIS